MDYVPTYAVVRSDCAVWRGEDCVDGSSSYIYISIPLVGNLVRNHFQIITACEIVTRRMLIPFLYVINPDTFNGISGNFRNL